MKSKLFVTLCPFTLFVVALFCGMGLMVFYMEGHLITVGGLALMASMMIMAHCFDCHIKHSLAIGMFTGVLLMVSLCTILFFHDRQHFQCLTVQPNHSETAYHSLHCDLYWGEWQPYISF